MVVVEEEALVVAEERVFLMVVMEMEIYSQVKAQVLHESDILVFSPYHLDKLHYHRVHLLVHLYPPEVHRCHQLDHVTALAVLCHYIYYLKEVLQLGLVVLLLVQGVQW